MCMCYGMSPSAYLFPGAECPHFRLLVDTIVYEVGRPPQKKLEAEYAAMAAGAKIKN